MWDKRICSPAFPELVGRCHACVEQYGSEGEKKALEALKKDETQNGMHFASLMTFVCQAHMPAQSVKARTALGGASCARNGSARRRCARRATSMQSP